MPANFRVCSVWGSQNCLSDRRSPAKIRLFVNALNSWTQELNRRKRRPESLMKIALPSTFQGVHRWSRFATFCWNFVSYQLFWFINHLAVLGRLGVTIGCRRLRKATFQPPFTAEASMNARSSEKEGTTLESSLWQTLSSDRCARPSARIVVNT